MKSIVESIIQSDSIKNEFLKPFGQYVYNEVYFYILIILVYCGVLFVGVLGTLIYLLQINKQLKTLQNIISSQDIEL
jgi:hypothetical protein